MALSSISTRPEKSVSRKTIIGGTEKTHGVMHMFFFFAPRFVADLGVFSFSCLSFGPGQYTDIDTQLFYITLLADQSFKYMQQTREVSFRQTVPVRSDND
jgi:hypothetical protein